jgi:fatty-acyl-CoA synthase
MTTAHPIRSLDDLARFEAALPLEERLPGLSVFDVFVAAADRHPDRAANLFAALGGDQPGVAYMLRRLVETHATRWGAEADLRNHAERTIAERPAWPRHIHIVDAAPLTSVGKISKPPLRSTAFIAGERAAGPERVRVRGPGVFPVKYSS